MSEPKTVVVSAYYKIPSKASHDFYREHLKRWFRSIRVPVIFFTTADVRDEILTFRIPLDHVSFQLLPFEELTGWSRHGRDFWNRQKKRDPEHYHTPDLAVIWYEKKEFVRRAMELSDADVFIWTDAGCVRDIRSEYHARKFGTRCPAALNDGTLHFERVYPLPRKEYYRYPDIGIAGGFQAGNRDAWRKHSELYEEIMVKYDSAGISCNSDQYIILSCMDLHPEFYTVHNPPGNKFGNWFFFLEKL